MNRQFLIEEQLRSLLSRVFGYLRQETRKKKEAKQMNLRDSLSRPAVKSGTLDQTKRGETRKIKGESENALVSAGNHFDYVENEGREMGRLKYQILGRTRMKRIRGGINIIGLSSVSRRIGHTKV
ncbi:hypothetical protein OUZ56_009428 [Daphnia magna]|uniref:Uncharacterized protein n=1 Tax=Daphnia magna TaxID=35525 RepID=A0ABR0AFY7_9CRUS|nr:hypothetical protein OUZ56_009428 [Daphnia magna]